MIRRYETEDGVYFVDAKAKRVIPSVKGETVPAQDYEFFEHQPDGSLYFHARDPVTGALTPFTTTPVVSVR